MLRRSVVRTLASPLAFAAGLLLAAGFAVADGPGPPTKPRPGDEGLRESLRKAAAAVAGLKGEAKDSALAPTFRRLAEAQESAWDAEGARSSRDEAAKLVPPDAAEGIWALRSRAIDRANAGDAAEAEQSYGKLLAIATAPTSSSPGNQLGARPSDAALFGVTLAERLAETDGPEAALRVLARAREAAAADPSYESAFFVARGQSALGDREAARATIAIARPRVEAEAKANPGRVFYARACLVTALWMAGDRDEALAIYRETERLARSQPEAGYARSNAVNQLPPILAAIGDYEGAFRLVSEQADDERRAERFRDVVGVIARAAGVLGAAREARSDPPIDREAAVAALRLAADAARSFRDEEAGFQGLAYAAEIQAKLGDLEGSRASYAALPARKDESHLTARLAILVEQARSAWKSGDRTSAEADLAAALALAESLPEEGPDHRFSRFDGSRPPGRPRDLALGRVAVVRAGLGHMEGALEAAGRIQDASYRSWPLTSAAEARLVAGDPDSAFRLATPYGREFWSITVLVRVADARAAVGDQAGAVEALDLALSDAEDFLKHRPHDPSIPPFRPFPSVNEWYATPEAPELERRRHAAAAFEVARIRSRKGDAYGAHAALAGVEEVEWREAAILREVLARQARDGDAPGALDRAVRVVRPADRLWAIGVVCGEIARRVGPPAGAVGG